MNTSPKDSNLSLSTRPKAVSVNALTQHSTVCTAHSIHKSQPGPREWMCGKSCQLQLDKPDYNGLRRLQIVPMCIPILLRKYLQRSRDGSVSFSSPCRFKVVPQVSRVMEGEYDSLVWGLCLSVWHTLKYRPQPQSPDMLSGAWLCLQTPLVLLHYSSQSGWEKTMLMQNDTLILRGIQN